MQTLARAYPDILSIIPQHQLDLSRAHESDFLGLSGLFLPSTSEAYNRSARKIMVVGRETRAWNVLRGKTFTNIDGYINIALQKQQKFLCEQLPGPEDKGQSLFNLLRRLLRVHGNDSVAWATLSASPGVRVLYALKNLSCAA